MTNSPIQIPVPLSRQPYEVIIQEGGLNNIGKELLKAGIQKGIKVLVVSNEDVAEPYSKICLNSLSSSGYDPNLITVEAGEQNKNLSTISIIHNAAYSAKIERGSLFIALGGGVVGDMTGFAASTWLRGIDVVQIPTTLLAMVDAAIGGKTGVNHSGGKNLIGAFHQPRLVLIDPSTLTTLPRREFIAGMAEVIKYGIIEDLELFNYLEKIQLYNETSSMQLDQSQIYKILERSVKTKAKIVTADEKEKGIRAILNYGHTFGHVIETLCGYGTWLHGEAVAMGMVAVGELSVIRGDWTKEEANRQKKLIQKTGLPYKWPKLDRDKVLDTLQGDKKVKDGNIRFIIPKKIGLVELQDTVSTEEIKYCLELLN